MPDHDDATRETPRGGPRVEVHAELLEACFDLELAVAEQGGFVVRRLADGLELLLRHLLERSPVMHLFH